MKKYYTNNGEQNLGSFDLNNLKSRGIDRNTLVWFFGLERWLKVRSISELKELFSTSWKRRKDDFHKSTDGETSTFFNDRLLLFVALGLILGFGILFYSFYITSRITQDEQRSFNELEQSKELFLLDKGIVKEELKIVSVEALPEKATVLLLAEEKEAVAKRIAQILIELDMASQNLTAAEQELLAAKSFQFLRMNNDKQQVIEAVNKKIEVWKEEIKALESEMSGLDPRYVPK